MAKLKCDEHGRRVMVTTEKVIHRSDGTGCNSTWLHIGMAQLSSQQMKDEAVFDVPRRRIPFLENPCECEHFSHFPDEHVGMRLMSPEWPWDTITGKEHYYLSVTAGETVAAFVGAICDECAEMGHGLHSL